MYLVQILLPLVADDRVEVLRELQTELVRKFGGITSYSRAPAVGLWKEEESTTRDNIVVYEVMVESIDAAWWHGFRLRSQETLRQELIVVRALPMVSL